MRRGHSRPAGTTTRVRMHGMPTEPALEALVYDEPPELERAYRIVGVEEVARPGRWNLVLERIEWRELLTSTDAIAFGIERMPR